MKIIIGIDPGATNVGICVRQGDTVLFSSTYARPDVIPQVAWATLAVKKFEEEVLSQFKEEEIIIGIEDVTSPSAYMGGKLQLLNPSNTIKLAVVVGAFAQRFPQAVIIRPGKNGSQPADTYPAELNGRRPVTLQGSNNSGTRNHERSAYDVAGLVEAKLREGFKLDMQTDELNTELLKLPLKTLPRKKKKTSTSAKPDVEKDIKSDIKGDTKTEAKTDVKAKNTVSLKAEPQKPTKMKENNLRTNNLFGEYL